MDEEFFKVAFRNYEEIPSHLVELSTELCTVYDIKGEADPVYILNVIGAATGIGSTNLGFQEGKVKNRDKDFNKRIQTALKHLSHSYKAIREQPKKAEDILQKNL